MDRARVSLGRNRTPAPAHNPGRQKVRLKRFRLSGTALRARRELLLKVAQPIGGCSDRLVALGKRKSNLAMAEFRPMVEAGARHCGDSHFVEQKIRDCEVVLEPEGAN